MSKPSKYRDKDSAKEVADKMLSTIEGRRDQITNRSTVCLAATSGLLVLAVQFISDICEQSDFSDFCFVTILLLICVVICAWSIITSLDLIKMISRKKHMGPGQRHTDPNIFYFGWIEKQTEDQIKQLFEKMTLEQQLAYEARQAISLSKNLDFRYKQLDKTYKLFFACLIIYVLAIICFVFIKYSWIDILKSTIDQINICGE